MEDDQAAEAEALTRLEQALDRIALAGKTAPPPPSGPDRTQITERLDVLIAQIRGALEPAIATEKD